MKQKVLKDQNDREIEEQEEIKKSIVTILDTITEESDDIFSRKFGEHS